MRSAAARAALGVGQAVVILVLGAALSEIALRLYQRVNPVFVFPGDHYSRFRGKPFAPDYGYGFRLNSHGFKDVEFQRRKPPNTFRILGIGDSFAFGVVPYEFNYLTLLEQDLAHVSPRAEVINMGIPSIGPREYAEVFLREGVELSPDFVLLSFFLGNDFDVMPPRAPRSYLWTFLRYLYRYLFFVRDQGIDVHGTALYADDHPTFAPDFYNHLELERSIIFRKGDATLPPRVRAVGGHLEKIKRVCDARRIGLLVVVIPDEMQVNRDLQIEVVKASGAPPEDFDFLLPNRDLEAELDRLGIASLDLTARFREAAGGGPLYKPRDTHWNIAGNRLAADLIRDALLGEGGRLWPPRRP